MKKQSLLTCIVLGLILLSSCSQNEQMLHVGVVIPLTGPVSAVGEDFLNGMNIAMEQEKPAIKLYIEDSMSTPTGGLTAAQNLFTKAEIDIIVSLQSAVVIPLLSIADEHDVPILATAVSQDQFTNRSINAFRLFPSAQQEAKPAAAFANTKFSNISILTISDEYGVSMKEHFKKDLSIKVIHEEEFDPAERDFRTLLLKLSGSDAIYFIGYPPHYLALLKGRTEMENNMSILSNIIMASNFVTSQAGNMINVYATMPVSLADNKIFREKYLAKYKREPDWTAPFGYDTVLFLDAISKRAEHPRKALTKVTIEGLNGKIAFDNSREVPIPIVVAQIKG